MYDNFEKKLVQDAKQIQQQAAARLQEVDLSQQLQTQLKLDDKSSKTWLLPVAAAICLSVMIGLVVEEVEPNQFTEPQVVASTLPIEFKFNDIPAAIEQSLNQPLQREQQAIIEDLKLLRTQLLSI